jgi:apolipoprotein N-acyltransferase
MRTDRWLIASLALLVSGVWSLLEWCHGTMGLAFAYPLAGTKLTIDITSTGGIVILGIPLVILGLLLMLIALLGALLDQFRSHARPSKPKEPTPSTSVPKTS